MKYDNPDRSIERSRTEPPSAHRRSAADRWTRALVAAVLSFVGSALVLAPGAPAAAWEVSPVASPDAVHVSADPLPTVQINGVVWDQHIIGNTVYVAGDFTHARPAGSAPGVNETPRANVLAYNLTTGNLITSFVANTNAYVRTITSSPDGSRLYIGGLFTSVNGVDRYRIAALDPTTGAVVPTFFASVGYFVYDLVATDTTVYAGGVFTQAGDASGLQARANLAAFDAASGTLLPWAPSANDAVWTIAISPDRSRVFAGGMFSEVNGSSRLGMAAISASSGAVLSFPPNNDVWAVGPNGAMTDFRVANGALYGSAFTFGRAAGNIEGIFKVDLTTNQIVWIDDCHGDTYQHLPVNGYVYKSSHVHYCGNIGGVTQSDGAVTQWNEHGRHAQSYRDEVAGQVLRDPWNYHNLEGYPAPSQTSWAPEWRIGSFTGLGQATWAVEGNSNYVLYGGEFLSVNGIAQQGLVRFAVRSIAPNTSGPALVPTNLKVTSPAAGEVRVSLPANFDRDDHVLTYELLRGNTVIETKQVASTFWDRPAVSFQRTGLTPGETHNYWVRVRDPWGNATWTPIVPVTISGGASESPYVDRVIADGARIYWRLGESPGASTANDLVGFNDGAVTSMTFGRPGALIGDPNTAASPTSDNSRVVQPGYFARVSGGHTERHPVQHELSVEIWFRTTSNQGGRLIGFGSSDGVESGSTSRDRHLYLTNDGRVVFGVRTSPGGTGAISTRINRVVQSSAGFNDGRWHHAVGTLAADGMRLYVDGSPAGTPLDDTIVNTGTGYYGYWRVGADGLADSNSNRNWPNAPSSRWLNGDLDEAAVYYDALTPRQVADHWILSGHGSGNVAPSAAFTSTPTFLRVAFDGSASSDPDGTVASYAWNFGDGSSGSGRTPSHTYASPGTYTVTLTVTDDDGATGQTSRSVTVVAEPNDAPSAAISVTSQAGLTVQLDGSGSSDPDGTIVGYSWNFGDGSSATGRTTSHTYASSGTYTVTLTVTDDDGATGQASRQVTVAPGNLGPTASFTASPNLLQVAFDASASNDPDGTIASYAWNFGDGSAPGSGRTPSHTYASSGAYTVTLIVTDDDGATGQTSRQVEVDADNTAPTASFESSAVFTSVDFDASKSTDPDGTIASYRWNFGDGSPSGSGRTASHTYATPNTYTVTLTVTDDDGASRSTTREIVATRPPTTATQPAARVAASGTYCFPTVGTVPGDFVAVNITPVNATTNGNGALHSSDDPPPATANVNFRRGSIDPNVAVAKVGADGEVCFTNSKHGPVDIVVDQLVVGDGATFTPPTADGAVRLADTRIGLGGATVPASGTRCVTASGSPGQVALVNITPVNATTRGNGSLHSSDDPPSGTANVNFGAGTVDPNVAFATIGADGKLCFTNSKHGPVDIVLDQLITGDAAAFSLPTPDGAARLADTRIGLGGSTLQPTQTRCVAVRGADPGDWTAINITPVNATTNGNGALHSSDDPPPATANVNFGAGTVDPNLGFAEVGADGKVCFTNSKHGPVDIVLDQLIVAGAGAFHAPTPDGAVRLTDTRVARH